jgi:hypothetical protein
MITIVAPVFFLVQKKLREDSMTFTFVQRQNQILQDLVAMGQTISLFLPF